MDRLFWIGLVGAAVALLFAWLQSNRVRAFSEGNDTMKKIAAAIRQGANAYLKHQYATVSKVFFVVFLILLQGSICWITGLFPLPSSPAASTPL